MARYRQTEEIVKLMDNPEIIRNTSIIAHVDHGKTTLSDSLLAAAGIISTQTAGQKLLGQRGCLVAIHAIRRGVSRHGLG